MKETPRHRLREDVHALVAAQLDRTDKRRADPILCDYLSDLARLFVNLLEEEARHRADEDGLDVDEQVHAWGDRRHG